MSQGRIFPQHATILQRNASHTSIVGPYLEGEIDGELGQKILTEITPKTKQLLEQHPHGKQLEEILSGPSIPLQPDTALQLQGFDTLFLEITGKCNEQCLHCYAGSGPNVTTQLSLAQCEQILLDAKELGFKRIQCTGGDPLLHEDLEKIVASAFEKKFSVIEIYTNGLLLRENLLKRLLPYQPRFAFSFYSHRPEIHDQITQVSGSQLRTLQAIQRALASGRPVRVSIIVREENQRDVESTVELLYSLGVESVTASNSHAVGRGDYFSGNLPPISNGSHRAPGSSQEITGTLCVASDGVVFPCIFNRVDPLGNIQNRSLSDIVQSPKFSGLFQAVGSQQLQCYGCRLTARALRLCV